MQQSQLYLADEYAQQNGPPPPRFDQRTMHGNGYQPYESQTWGYGGQSSIANGMSQTARVKTSRSRAQIPSVRKPSFPTREFCTNDH